MESKTNCNLEDMPQLVIAKIMTFLNHKQLLMLEQVSKKFKYGVEDHFRTTDHLILGSLPEIDIEENQKLLQLIQRCGIRLRTIQFNVNVKKQCSIYMDWLRVYINHMFESGGEVISKTCPNIERIIMSPKMEGEIIALSTVESYAKHLYKIGDKCKLRAIDIHFQDDDDERAENTFKAIVNCYSNLQHIFFSYWNRQQLLRFLPQLIENGLKDLKICHFILDFHDAEQFCKIGINLHTLSFAVRFHSNDDIAFMNQLKLPKGMELEIFGTNTSSLALLNENVCDSVVKLACQKDDISDCSSIIKLKNLREFEGVNLEHAKIIAKESFPKLKQVDLCGPDLIMCNQCREVSTQGYRNSECESIFLQQLLTNKGHQLTLIRMWVCDSLDLVVKAVKYCKAALDVHLISAVYRDHTSITIEDIMAILQLPSLQSFSITQMVEAFTDVDDLKKKMKIAENAQSDFKFEYEEINSDGCVRCSYSFERIFIE